ncbi:hypothetical protein [Ruegeria sp. HKCCA5426]|uniref:hypothetical protein n=1 Tax=Ruegeria sp. HKCCA5426 TaxID=2682985 RepID=UPI001488A353|nr:hypothetical protein [Ruegeria sp. HKCCA5426]
MKKLATVKLPSSAGNTLEILAICQKAARQSGAGQDETLAFLEEATSGDHDFALAAIMKHFELRLSEW